MAKSNLLIRDYDNIRRILRDIYIFGCYSRDDFIEKGMSGRKYDNEQRRINAYLPEGFIRKRRVDKKVQYYCYYGPNTSGNDTLTTNHLAETYRNKSFTMLDITSYFFVLGILNDHPGLTLIEVLEEIPQLNEEILFTKDNLRVKLNELETCGLIQSQKDGRNVRYYVTEDIWKEYSEEELKQIYMLLDFIRNIMPFEMPYVFLQQKLKLYLLSRGIDDLPEGVFQFKHNHLFNVLDNEIMLDLLRALNGGRAVQLERTGADESSTVVPVKIIHECTYGRQYLLCMNCKDESALMIRLDRIDSVTMGDELTDEMKARAIERTADEEKCWCTSGLGNQLQRVVIEVKIDEERESYIIKRLHREGHGGKVTKLKSGHYHYETEVRDHLEMTPWIRSFGEHMRVIEDGGSGLSEHIAADWKRAVQKYETL